MRFLRYLLVPWTVFVVYSFFSFVFGQNGLYVRKHLEEEYLRLAKNYAVLQHNNNDMLRMRDNLIYDLDAFSVYMRQLGYGNRGERFIRIKGVSAAINVEMPAGEVFYTVGPEYISDKVIKIISTLFGLTVLVFFLIRDLPYLRGNGR